LSLASRFAEAQVDLARIRKCRHDLLGAPAGGRTIVCRRSWSSIGMNGAHCFGASSRSANLMPPTETLDSDDERWESVQG
jgi:hypothetical protein